MPSKQGRMSLATKWMGEEGESETGSHEEKNLK